jgi:hypothetical protein
LLPRRPPSFLGVLAPLIGLALTAGCGTGTTMTAEQPAADASGRTTTPSRSAAVPPSRTATTTPAASESATAAATTGEPVPTTLAGRLLTVEQLSASTGDRTEWRVRRTVRAEPAEPVSRCHKFGLTSIGALRVAARTFQAEDPATPADASSLVARFPDPKTARRAYAVLESWHAQCKTQLADQEWSEVGTLHEVAVTPPRASAGSYLLTYGPDEAGVSWADAQGMVRVGTKIALVSLRASADAGPGLPEDLEASVAAAVRTAADRLV